MAYVTTYDPWDVTQWSGIAYYIAKEFRAQGIHVEHISSLKESFSLFFKAKQASYSLFLRKQYLRDREPLIVKKYAEQILSRIKDLKVDVVFSPGTVPIACLDIDKPIVFWTDISFAEMVDFYEYFSNLCAESLNNGHVLEQSALERCRLSIYSSEWAAQTTLKHYKIDPQKVKVVPFGANIDNCPAPEEVESIIESRPLDSCKLLFLGVDWYRKGGDIALAATEQLNELGLKTELHIVGCTPKFHLPDYVITHGFISKSDEKGRQKLYKLFAGCHFLILPSRAECTPIVFNEASCFGLPSIAADTGGVASVVRDNINGKTFPLEAPASDYGTYIYRLMTNRSEYDHLARSTYSEFRRSLNWQANVRKAIELMHEYC